MGESKEPVSELISKRIKELGDWRGKTLERVRRLIREADSKIVEEWKWVKPTLPGTQFGPTTVASCG